jgi:hypothetical protein
MSATRQLYGDQSMHLFQAYESVLEVDEVVRWLSRPHRECGEGEGATILESCGQA